MKISPVTFKNTPNNTLHTKNQKTLSLFTTRKEDSKTNYLYNNSMSLSFASGKSINDYKKFRYTKNNFTPEAEAIYQKGIKIAKFSHSKEFETWHFVLASLLQAKKYIKALDDGIIKYDSEDRQRTPFYIQELVSSTYDGLGKPEERQKIQKVIDEQIEFMKENFVKPDKKSNPRPHGVILPSKKFIDDITEIHSSFIPRFNTPAFFDSYFLAAAENSQDKKIHQVIKQMDMSLKKALMIDDTRVKEKSHLQFYDDKADVLWKNIALGNNNVIVNDDNNKESYAHLISSFVNLIHKPDKKYGSLTPKNTEIYVLNDLQTFDFIDGLIKEIRSDKNKKDITSIIIFDFATAAQGSINEQGQGVINLETLQLMHKIGEKSKKFPNVHLVFRVVPEAYYANTKINSSIRGLFVDAALQTLPVLNAADARKYLTEQSGINFIKSKTKKDFAPETILKAIEISNTQDGNYPDKVIQLLNSVSKYFVDKEDITADDIEQYIEETKSLSEASSNTEEKNIIFDTGKTLDDIKGSPMTKADAKSVVEQIKNGTLKTKGYVIYHNANTAYGGGRRHTAEAIAGEAQIPMIVINAKDFALKDIDALSQQANLSEIKIKKLVSSAKAQAEANKFNTAMIFIENFDNFASDPLYGISSIYEQKAFTQLMSEMDSTRKDDKVNLLVIGSMNRIELLDSANMKPYKFLNSIVVYQPHDEIQRKDVIQYYIDKMQLQIEDEKEDKEKTIKNLSESTQGFSIVDIMYLLDTANGLSKERRKDKIDSKDISEALLQTMTGRANTMKISDHYKRIIASHEAGHALTLQIMYNIMKKQNINWHLPPKVDFITLDPRSNYGGAMYPKNSENEELSFESLMSDIVSTYGGHSSENIIYGISGSWGITSDMQQANQQAEFAVTYMGMGPRTGVRHVPINYQGELNVSEAKKQLIEEDIDSFLVTGKKISDSIVMAYKDFIIEFTKKYAPQVATGDCFIPAEQFEKELNDWIERQSDNKKQNLLELETQILEDLDKCKNGEV